jgi:hypothetical protein
MKKEPVNIKGKIMWGIKIPKKEAEKIIPFNDWERFEVNPQILSELDFRKTPKEVLKAYASGCSISTPSGAVFGVCEARQDGEIIDRDHTIGFLIDEDTIFLTTDKDKSKEHHYKDTKELKENIDKTPPHEQD